MCPTMGYPERLCIGLTDHAGGLSRPRVECERTRRPEWLGRPFAAKERAGGDAPFASRKTRMSREPYFTTATLPPTADAAPGTTTADAVWKNGQHEAVVHKQTEQTAETTATTGVHLSAANPALSHSMQHPRARGIEIAT